MRKHKKEILTILLHVEVSKCWCEREWYMKKKNRWVLLILVFVIIVTTLFVVYGKSKVNLSENVERRAYQELETSVDNHISHIKQALGNYYVPLETLATYLGTKDGFDFVEEREFTDAIVITHHLCMLGYADMDGNAVSYAGEKLGNISDRDYFKQAVRWDKGDRGLEFMLTTARVDEPRILFSAPVLHNNTLIGIVFAAYELEDFDLLLFADNFSGEEVVFVTDSSGNIIMKNPGGKTHITDGNLFEKHFNEGNNEITAETLMKDMEENRSGAFKYKHEKTEYVAYAPLGVNDWYVFSMVPVSTVNAKFDANMKTFSNTIDALMVAYVISVGCIAFFMLYFINCNRKAKSGDCIQKENFVHSEIELDKDTQYANEDICAEKALEDFIAVPHQSALPEINSEKTSEGEHQIFARTFGYFDLFLDGQPLHLTDKEKEFLALLIDRQGGTITSSEAISFLWENEPAGEKQLARYRQLVARLNDKLKHFGIDDILVSNRGVRNIDVSKVVCDLWEALAGNEEYQKTFQGVYMFNYSWAEERAIALQNQFEKNE